MKKTDCSDDAKRWKSQQKPNCEEILKGLKDFQKDTVDYVFPGCTPMATTQGVFLSLMR